MSGRVVRSVPPRHVCLIPVLNIQHPSFDAGTVWECECGKQWVTSMTRWRRKWWRVKA